MHLLVGIPAYNEAATTTEVSDRRRQELLAARSPEAFADRILEILR